ncbi:MAG: HesA/MoeB/ThiF family protein [Candidatus Bathyarchaeota archaeon]|nr:HesA/MoeB/ThiF family protein [Candidatus Bathyarchaeota archaeon]
MAKTGLHKKGSFSLNKKEQELYSRQIVLREIGYNGQLRLKNARVCIIGLGGLGSLIATQLTAMGVGHIRLVDRDVVEIANLHRQYLYDTKVLGRSKAEVAAERLALLNPYVNLEPSTISINSENAEEVIEGMDVVADGLDAMKPRYAINRACVKLKTPYVFGSAVMTHGNASTIIPKETPCLECFFGNIEDANMPKCAVVGVHPSILGLIASVEVSEVIRVLLGREPVLRGRLLFSSLEELSMDLVDVLRNELCPVCGEESVTEPFHSERELVEEVCGREGKRTLMVIPKEDLKLQISKLSEILENKGFHIETEGRLSITSTRGEQKVSIMQSGVMIGEGIGEKENLITLYRDIITNSLGVSWMRICD